jgi:hypothetical protein
MFLTILSVLHLAGALVALDAEFVCVEREESEISERFVFYLCVMANFPKIMDSDFLLLLL